MNTLKASVTEATEDFQASMDHLDANKEVKFLKYIFYIKLLTFKTNLLKKVHVPAFRTPNKLLFGGP